MAEEKSEKWKELLEKRKYRLDLRRFAFERKKLREDNLRAELRDSYVFYRETVALLLRVFFYGGLAFTAIASVYISLYNGYQLPQTEFARKVVSMVGLGTAMFFLIAQMLAYTSYDTSRKLYLYPYREALGLPVSPPGVDRERRKRLEGRVAVLLVAVHVLYVLLWGLVVFFPKYLSIKTGILV